MEADPFPQRSGRQRAAIPRDKTAILPSADYTLSSFCRPVSHEACAGEGCSAGGGGLPAPGPALCCSGLSFPLLSNVGKDKLLLSNVSHVQIKALNEPEIIRPTCLKPQGKDSALEKR